MTQMLIQMAKLRKAIRRAVNLSVYLGITIITSCNVAKNDSGSLLKHYPESNCVKYTLHYTTDEENAVKTLDTLFVHGETRICATSKLIPFTEIFIYDGRTSEKREIKSDQKGRFSIKLIPGFYRITARGAAAHLEIPSTYLGHDGNVLKMDMYLATYTTLINEMNDPKLQKEVEKLKKRNKGSTK